MPQGGVASARCDGPRPAHEPPVGVAHELMAVREDVDARQHADRAETLLPHEILIQQEHPGAHPDKRHEIEEDGRLARAHGPERTFLASMAKMPPIRVT